MKKVLTFLALLTILSCGKNDEHISPEKEVSESEVIKEESTLEKQEAELKVLGVEGVSSGKPSIEIIFSDEMDFNSDLGGYIKLVEKVDYSIVKLRNKVVITGNFDVGETYTVEILKGLKSKRGQELKEEYRKTVAFKDLEPKMAFSNEGIILPAINEKRISFKSINVKKVKVEVKKVYENNMTQFLQEFKFKGNGNVFDYALQGEFYKVGDVVFQKEYPLDYIKNKWIQTEIDLGKLAGEKGFYIVELSFDKDGIDYKFPIEVEEWQKYSFFRNNGQIGKVVLLSDMGIVAQKSKDEFLVTVMNVTKNTQVKGAKVKALTLNNQLIDEKITDDKGEVSFAPNDKIFYILSETESEKSILKLEDAQLSYDGFSVDGLYADKGVKAFLYSDRGVYRPGDEIYLSLIARNSDGEFPEGHPIKIDVYTPTGKKYIENKILTDGKNGFYTYNFKTENSSETGLWRVEAEIGGTPFRKDIPIETIVPYKIKVETEIPKEINIKDTNKFSVGITSNYLFGSPSSNLPYESELVIKEEDINFEKFKNYTFKDPTNYSFNYRDSKEGVLDNEGKGRAEFQLSRVTPLSINLTGTVTTRVIETGGRPVINISRVSLKKFDTYIGVEKPADRYIKSGDKINLQVIAVTSDGENLVAGRKLKYRVYKNEYSWWWDYSDYGSFLKSIKSDKNTTLVFEKEFLSEDKPYIIDYEIEGTGEIFVEVEDLDTHQITGTNMYVSTWADPSINKKVDKLKMELDKNTYNIGEIAKVTFEGEKGAKALITIEKSGQILKRYWKDVEDIKNEEEIQVTEDMFTNGYVTISLFQDYDNYTNDRPLRLYGALPIVVKNEATKLEIDVTAPKEIKPNETFKVKVKNRAEKPMDYTIAVVDEGLLDITAFTTPDPWNYFYQKQALQITTYDNYNEVIGKTFGEVHQVLQTGGGDYLEDAIPLMSERSKNLGLDEAQRFNPVAMFKGVLTTDEKGEGEIEFTMGNYMGSVKVMVVGADHKAYGNGETTITVKAPVVMNSSLPRTLKTGDQFIVPVEIFALEDGLGDITVSIDFNGKVKNKKLTLKNNEKKTFYFTETVPDKIGTEKIKISVQSKVYSYEEVTDIDINSNNPYIYINEVKTVPAGKESAFNLPEEYIKGSEESSITISSSPILAIDQRLKWLIRYPYGCVEQTVSSIFPQLFIDELSSEKIFDRKIITANINSGIAKLGKFQLYDGSFTYWPGNRDADLWATNYVGQFLINAKNSGYYVPEDMFNRWVRFSKGEVKNSKDNINRKAYTLYLLALGGYPEISEMNLVYENYFQTLSLTSQWYLAAAYKLIGEDKIAEDIAGKLSTTVPVQDYDYYVDSYGSNFRDKAVVLEAYYTVYGKVEEKLYDEIVRTLQSNETISTQSTGYALLAIAQVVKAGKGEDIAGTIQIDGKIKNFASKDGKYVEIVPKGAKSIKIKSKSSKDIFVNSYWEGIPINYEGEDIAKNIKLERNYYDLDGKKYDPEYVASLPVGKSFWLEVKVLPADDVKGYFHINDIALTQILPTGWEIENVRLLNQPYPKWIERKTRETYVDYEDIRDDRVMWFFDFNNYGSSGNSFFIKINTVTAGKYKIPGTMAEAMYNKNYEAYLKGFEVEVK